MFEIAICDDNVKDTNQLREILTLYSVQADIDFLISTFSHAEKLLSSKKTFDIIFLDVVFENSPTKITGIDVGKLLRNGGNKSVLVFFSSTNVFSIDGYGAKADRYLVKPIMLASIEELFFSISVLQTKYPKINFRAITDKLSAKNVYCSVNDILYCTTEKTRVVVTTSTKKLHTWETLVCLYQKMPMEIVCYVRRGTFVNLEYISLILGNELFMVDGHSIKIGNAYKKEMLHKYLLLQWGNVYEPV